MKVTASLKNLRTSPRKVRLVTDSIAGMNASAALVQLQNVVKKSSLPVEKLLASALANAENNFGLDRDNMYVSSILVGEGARLKRWLPRAHGRATLILKRTCHIKLELEERIEGKNRKSKEELEKERAEREALKAKMIEEELAKLEKDEKAEEATPEEKTVKAKPATRKKAAASKTTGQDKGFLNKVFQRKSA